MLEMLHLVVVRATASKTMKTTLTCTEMVKGSESLFCAVTNGSPFVKLECIFGETPTDFLLLKEINLFCVVRKLIYVGE